MYLYVYHSKNNEKRQSGNSHGDRSVFSEKLVRKALSDYAERLLPGISGTLLRKTEIIRAPKGKPYLTGLTGIGHEGEFAVHYSVSHSGNWWACLMAEEPVGFDLEVCRDKVNFVQIAQRFFTEDECELISSEGRDLFFEVWVRKEAYVKYLGTGLAEGLDSFSVVEDGRLASRVVIKNDAGRSRQPCFVYPYAIGSGVKAAYCSESGNPIKAILPLKYDEINEAGR